MGIRLTEGVPGTFPAPSDLMESASQSLASNLDTERLFEMVSQQSDGPSDRMIAEALGITMEFRLQKFGRQLGCGHRSSGTGEIVEEGVTTSREVPVHPTVDASGRHGCDRSDFLRMFSTSDEEDRLDALKRTSGMGAFEFLGEELFVVGSKAEFSRCSSVSHTLVNTALFLSVLTGTYLVR